MRLLHSRGAKGVSLAVGLAASLGVGCAGGDSSRSSLVVVDGEVVGALAAGDFNGDQHPDLAYLVRTLSTHPSGGNNRLVRFSPGRGDGTFGAPHDVGTTCQRVQKRGGTSLGADFDGDGLDDYLCTGADTGLELFRGARSGPPVLAFSPANRDVGNLAAVDLDADGRRDIVDLVAQAGSLLHNFSVYRNAGDGGFAAVTYFGGRTVKTSDFLPGDFNADGRLDFLVAGNNCLDECLALGLYAGTGPGQLAVPTAFDRLPDEVRGGQAVANVDGWDLAAGDLDGDGDLDAVVTAATSFVQVMLNDGAGRFSQGARVPVGTTPRHVVSADFDGDGHLDLLTLDASSRTVTVVCGVGNGTFGSGAGVRRRQVQLDGQSEPYDLVLADFDGDGRPDVAFAEDGTRDLSLRTAGSVQVLLHPGC